jgi:hypothetical protein
VRQGEGWAKGGRRGMLMLLVISHEAEADDASMSPGEGGGVSLEACFLFVCPCLSMW